MHSTVELLYNVVRNWSSPCKFTMFHFALLWVLGLQKRGMVLPTSSYVQYNWVTTTTTLSSLWKKRENPTFYMETNDSVEKSSPFLNVKSIFPSVLHLRTWAPSHPSREGGQGGEREGSKRRSTGLKVKILELLLHFYCVNSKFFGWGEVARHRNRPQACPDQHTARIKTERMATTYRTCSV